jgi:hypothetical protein
LLPIKAATRTADKRWVLDESLGAEIAIPVDSAPAAVPPPAPPRIVQPGTGHRGPERRLVSWRALLLAAGILAGLLAAFVELGGGGPNEAAQAAAMTGYWQATGQVLQAHDSAIQTTGEVIDRLWRIDGRCGQHGCDLQLTREIAGGTAQVVGGALTAPLIWDEGHWQATFSEPNVYCEGADGDATVPGTEASTWTITLAAGRTIAALEHTTTAGPDCITGTTELDWRAGKASVQQSPVSS